MDLDGLTERIEKHGKLVNDLLDNWRMMLPAFRGDDQQMSAELAREQLVVLTTLLYSVSPLLLEAVVQIAIMNNRLERIEKIDDRLARIELIMSELVFAHSWDDSSN